MCINRELIGSVILFYPLLTKIAHYVLLPTAALVLFSQRNVTSRNYGINLVRIHIPGFPIELRPQLRFILWTSDFDLEWSVRQIDFILDFSVTNWWD